MRPDVLLRLADASFPQIVMWMLEGGNRVGGGVTPDQPNAVAVALDVPAALAISGAAVG